MRSSISRATSIRLFSSALRATTGIVGIGKQARVRGRGFFQTQIAAARREAIGLGQSRRQAPPVRYEARRRAPAEAHSQARGPAQ